MQRQLFVAFISLAGLALGSPCRAQGTPGQVTTRPVEAARAGQSLAPQWYPIAPEHQKYLDEILQFWEHTTNKTERYRCTFRRWEYEPPNTVDPKTFSEGVIKYASPDKGLFQVTKIRNRQPPKEPGGKPQYADGQYREHWVCDGRSIFEFDYHNKLLKQRPLPEQMRGQRITDGPLPFLFGAKVSQIKDRFWLRVVTPSDSKGEYHLEGVPKHRSDAANFATMQIILDETDFLPKGMILFYRNKAQTTFEFENRETNWSLIRERLNLFHRQFFEPKLPDSSWTKVVEPMGGPGGPTPVGTARRVDPPQRPQRSPLQLRRR